METAVAHLKFLDDDADLRLPACTSMECNKQCTTDPLPTDLLKSNVDMLAPFITELFNRSMSSGAFPSHFKAAFITPLLKKPNLDQSDGKSYWPISNLTVLSKLLEWLVAWQLIDHLNVWKLMPTLQSAFRANHSTETATLRWLVTFLMHSTEMILLLWSYSTCLAFDTVDHKTLIRHQETSYCIHCTVLDWFSAYLEQCTQHVHCRGHSSSPSVILCGSFKDLSWDQSCLSSTLLTLLILWGKRLVVLYKCALIWFDLIWKRLASTSLRWWHTNNMVSALWTAPRLYRTE